MSTVPWNVEILELFFGRKPEQRAQNSKLLFRFSSSCNLKYENGASVSDYRGMMWRGSCKNKTLGIGMFLFLYLNKQWPGAQREKNVQGGPFFAQRANSLNAWKRLVIFRILSVPRTSENETLHWSWKNWKLKSAWTSWTITYVVLEPLWFLLPKNVMSNFKVIKEIGVYKKTKNTATWQQLDCTRTSWLNMYVWAEKRTCQPIDEGVT